MFEEEKQATSDEITVAEFSARFIKVRDELVKLQLIYYRMDYGKKWNLIGNEYPGFVDDVRTMQSYVTMLVESAERAQEDKRRMERKRDAQNS